MNAQEKPVALRRRLGAVVAERFARGAILLLPLLVTFWLLKFAFDTTDGLLQPAISAVLGRELIGLGFAIIIVALLVVGTLASTAVFRWVGHAVDRGIISAPGIGSVYGTTKKLFPGSGEGGMGFDTVVRVEYPRRGAWAVGFPDERHRGRGRSPVRGGLHALHAHAPVGLADAGATQRDSGGGLVIVNDNAVRGLRRSHLPRRHPGKPNGKPLLTGRVNRVTPPAATGTGT